MGISGKLNRMGIQKKLLFGYGCFVLLPILVVCGFFLQRMVSSTLSYTEDLDRVYFDQTAANVDSMLRANFALADSATSSYELMKYVNTLHEFHPDEIEPYLDYGRIYDSCLVKFPITSGSLSKLSVYTTNPTILTDNVFLVSQKQTPLKKEIRERVMKAAGSNVLLDPILEDGKAYLAVGKLIVSDGQERIQNILLLRTPESELCSLLGRGDQQTYVVGSSGVVLSSNVREAVGKDAEEFPALQRILERMPDQPVRETDTVSFYRSMEEEPGVSWKLVSIMSRRPLMEKVTESVWLCIMLCLLSIVGAVGFLLLLSKTLTDRLKLLVRYATDFHGGEAKPEIRLDGHDEITELYEDMGRMMDTINRLINGVYRLELEKKDAEIKALQSQIDPHFVFNTMESVRMRLWKNRDFQTAEIIQKFALLMRRSMEWDKDTVTLREEVELVKAYLQIQQFRFSDRICFELQVDPALSSCKIPKFSLQPLAENAIRHGLEPKQGHGQLRISSEIGTGEFFIFVEDNGVGMEAETLQKLQAELDSLPRQENIGIRNVHRRIRLLFGEPYGLHFRSEPGQGTTAEVRLPLCQFEEGEKEEI